MLIALDDLTPPLLINRKRSLKRILPQFVPSEVSWKRPIVRSCSVFNLESWNKHLRRYPVIRVSDSTSGVRNEAVADAS